jgi:hypothetical protein
MSMVGTRPAVRAPGTMTGRLAGLAGTVSLNSLVRGSAGRAAAYSPAIPVTDWPAGTCPRIDPGHRARNASTPLSDLAIQYPPVESPAALARPPASRYRTRTTA